MNVLSIELSKMFHDDVLDTLNLMDDTWPENKPDEAIDNRIQSFYHRENDMVCHLIKVDGVLAAYAESFVRLMFMEGKEKPVLALAAVCVKRSHRSLGLGRQVVSDAFNRLSADFMELSLFQTAVPEFYRKMGAEIIENKIINSFNLSAPDKNPFWDEHIMVYPSHRAEIKGVIDIRGKGY